MLDMLNPIKSKSYLLTKSKNRFGEGLECRLLWRSKFWRRLQQPSLHVQNCGILHSRVSNLLLAVLSRQIGYPWS